MNLHTPLASLKVAGKQYRSGDQVLTALQPTTLDFYSNQLTLILGPSGSGKTTLLSLMGCVIFPTSGEVWVDGQLVNELSASKLAKLRLEKIGFVFQSFNLLAPLSVWDNVAMPLKLLGMPSKNYKEKVLNALEKVGMTEKIDYLPKNLSGGQQQRVAVARALVTEPKLILCDEPTASLDQNSLTRVMEQLRALSKAGKSVAVVTHDPRLIPFSDRVIEVKDGSAQEISITASIDPFNSHDT